MESVVFLFSSFHGDIFMDKKNLVSMYYIKLFFFLKRSHKQSENRGTAGFSLKWHLHLPAYVKIQSC